MIARIWSAQTTPAQAPAYADHLRSQVLPAVAKVDGYAGAMLLERAVPDGVEIIVITFWRSLDSIRGFAGADIEEAVVAEDAAALLARFDRRVRHFEVVANDAGKGNPAVGTGEVDHAS
jgi:heme-degrading monooxygenase HmoA